ncbi:MAG TPA: hypothetical protein VJX67_06715, partial [Blastocatellia bacterium]|nr:hypothetical protein [Blastocatellia bacterium]
MSKTSPKRRSFASFDRKILAPQTWKRSIAILLLAVLCCTVSLSAATPAVPTQLSAPGAARLRGMLELGQDRQSSGQTAAVGTSSPHRARGPISSRLTGQEHHEAEMHEEPEVPVPQGIRWNTIPAPLGPPSQAPTKAMRPSRTRRNIGSRTPLSPQAATDMTYQVEHDFLPSEVAPGQRSAVQEPSLASMGRTVFFTGNWYAAFSTDGGGTFSYVNPYTTFPSVNGGFCCDQVANYARNQDMMLWALQYNQDSTSGTLRIARAVGSNAVASNAWIYYDFTPQSFGFPSNNWMDFPNMTVGPTFLYLTSNVFSTQTGCPRCVFAGSVVWRVPLSELAAGGTIHWSYISRSDVGALRCTEGAGTTMYWAGFPSTSTLRIHHWDDSSQTVSWDNIPLNPFSFMNSGEGVAFSPDGTNWAARLSTRVLGATVTRGVISFMWPAKQDATFAYPYTIVAQFNQSDRSLISQSQVYSQSFAWLYMSASLNAAGNHAGVISYGGGSLYPNSAVWINDDIESGFAPLHAYQLSSSAAGPSSNVWGDFLSARPNKDFPNSWVAGTYYMNAGGSDSDTVARYVWFGRQRDLGGCSISPGQGSSGGELTAFQGAYDSAGGQGILGCATEVVQTNGFVSFAGTVAHFQLFDQGDIEYTINGSRAGQAYAVSGPFYSKWSSLGFTSTNPLGYPIGSQSAQSSSCAGTNLEYQQFEGGALEYHLNGTHAGTVYEVNGAIYTKWGQKGFAGCPLGLPISDEHDAASSGATGNTGRVNDFEGGHIYWITGAGAAFETHGSIDSLFTSMGATSSWLGFPISDEYVAQTGFARNDFEGGYITTTDGANYREFTYSSSSVTVSSSNPASGVNISATPADRNNFGSGVTPFTRNYNTNAVVTLGAPATAGANNFQKWQKDGVDLSNSQSVSVATNASHTMTAVYASAPPPQRTLTVASVNPSSGVSIASTTDLFGSSGGVTQFSLTYTDGAAVSLTAPTTAAGNNFQKWQVDGIDLTTSTAANLTMNGNHTATVIYLTSTTNYQGFQDGAGCGTISGWAWDANNPNSTVSVDIFDGNT